jgi:hypothetical protein
MTGREVLLAVLLAQAAFAGPPSPPVGPRPRAGLLDDLRFEMALRSEAKAEHAKAMALLESLRPTFGTDARLLYQIGRVRLAQGDRDGAARALAEIQALQPRHSLARQLKEQIAATAPASPGPGPSPIPAPVGESEWEKGDEFHLVIPVATVKGQLETRAFTLAEGMAESPLRVPQHLFKIRLEAQGARLNEAVFDPMPAIGGITETPLASGTFDGHALPPPEGMEFNITLPFQFRGDVAVVYDPNDHQLLNINLTPKVVTEHLRRLYRPVNALGVGAPVRAREPSDKVFSLARLGARMRGDYAPSGVPRGMYLRIRLIAELYMYPAVRRFPNEEAALHCHYLLWPLTPAPGVDELRHLTAALASYLDKPGAATVKDVGTTWSPLAQQLDEKLAGAIADYRKECQTKARVKLDATRRLRAYVNLCLVGERVAHLLADRAPASVDARALAAQALMLLQRYRLD